MADGDAKIEAWQRLVNGVPIHNLGLGSKDGRIDLSGISIPEPAVSRSRRSRYGEISIVSGAAKVVGAQWTSVDFTRSRLHSVLFYECSIRDCVFDECYCPNWGLWGTKLSDVTFRSADLRGAALGALHHGARNSFHHIAF